MNIYYPAIYTFNADRTYSQEYAFNPGVSVKCGDGGCTYEHQYSCAVISWQRSDYSQSPSLLVTALLLLVC